MSFGDCLRAHRKHLRFSQLQLALEVQASSKHISFLETGRAQPSRGMVLRLARAMDLKLRDRNGLLHAAGFASVFAETPLEDTSMAEIRTLLELLLRRNEPFGATVLNRRWDIVMMNAGYAQLWAMLTGQVYPAYTVLSAEQRPNALRVFVELESLRACVKNWNEVVAEFVPRLQRELRDADPDVRGVLEPLLEKVRAVEVRSAEAPRLVVPIEFGLGEQSLRLLTTLSVLGTPQDITLDELRLECFHPADAASDALVRTLVMNA